MSDPSHSAEAAGTHWNPEQYHKFSDHRLRPALDILARIPLESPKVVYDLGCGTGNVTRILAEVWNEARIVGLDHSKDMLREARSEPGRIQWVEADIEHWTPEKAPDVLFSNATLHWLPGHRDLFPRLARFLSAGGCLAVQMPLSWESPSHRLMRETLESFGTPALREAVSRNGVESTRVYYDLLTPSTRSLDIWETEYLHALEGHDPVLEWVKGTGLRPILDGLQDEERNAFLTKYASRLREAYPARPDGTTLYPFRRLFIVAVV